MIDLDLDQSIDDRFLLLLNPPLNFRPRFRLVNGVGGPDDDLLVGSLRAASAARLAGRPLASMSPRPGAVHPPGGGAGLRGGSFLAAATSQGNNSSAAQSPFSAVGSPAADDFLTGGDAATLVASSPTSSPSAPAAGLPTIGGGGQPLDPPNNTSWGVGMVARMESVGSSVGTGAGVDVGVVLAAGVAGTLPPSVHETSGAVVAGSAVHPTMDDDEEEDDMCGICMDSGDFVSVRMCGHTMCVDCASELLRLHPSDLVPCPFCRGIIRGFTKG